MDIFPQGNLKEEIKQLQEAEQQVKDRVTELAQKKETFKVSWLSLLLNMHTFCLAAKNYKRFSLIPIALKFKGFLEAHIIG